ncbi:hypothetical protein H5410_061123 [Solanum commersonii]|uniref:Uncharacterized protein n=1 Tax=Solanum commersonii TaxID=4109 RepID=A0A9J5W6W6_SOLCO|nr:hypothetical protein H5410_061123 [Solanum commersonii]
MKKYRLEDRRAHLASRRSTWRSPFVPRGRKTKTTKLIAGGSTWVQLERVNPSPFPTHSARESEWVKAEAMLNAAIRCSRETELIRSKLLERKFTPTIV